MVNIRRVSEDSCEDRYRLQRERKGDAGSFCLWDCVLVVSFCFLFDLVFALSVSFFCVTVSNEA